MRRILVDLVVLSLLVICGKRERECVCIGKTDVGDTKPSLRTLISGTLGFVHFTKSIQISIYSDLFSFATKTIA